ncbi:MAG: hypothetical protein AAGE52_17435 [Myxococcota bacterium]
MKVAQTYLLVGTSRARALEVLREFASGPNVETAGWEDVATLRGEVLDIGEPPLVSVFTLERCDDPAALIQLAESARQEGLTTILEVGSDASGLAYRARRVGPEGVEPFVLSEVDTFVRLPPEDWGTTDGAGAAAYLVVESVYGAMAGRMPESQAVRFAFNTGSVLSPRLAELASLIVASPSASVTRKGDAWVLRVLTDDGRRLAMLSVEDLEALRPYLKDVP